MYKICKKLQCYLFYKSPGGGPWPPTWVTWQNHEAKTVFLLIDISIWIVFDMYKLISEPGWRPDWFRDTFGKIHCENYTFFSATFKNPYWKKCWSLLPRFWRTLLPYFHFICIFYFMWSRKLLHKRLSLKIFNQEVPVKVWRNIFDIF